jgi:hypothetical protein
MMEWVTVVHVDRDALLGGLSYGLSCIIGGGRASGGLFLEVIDKDWAA